MNVLIIYLLESRVHLGEMPRMTMHSSSFWAAVTERTLQAWLLCRLCCITTEDCKAGKHIVLILALRYVVSGGKKWTYKSLSRRCRDGRKFYKLLLLKVYFNIALRQKSMSLCCQICFSSSSFVLLFSCAACADIHHYLQARCTVYLFKCGA